MPVNYLGAEMEAEKKPAFQFSGYAFGFFIVIGAVVAGNVLGRIIASLQGWHDFSYDKPGGVFYAVIQGGLGSYLALLASKSWLGDGKFCRFWLGVLVWILSGLMLAGIIVSLYYGSGELIGWNTLSGIVSLVAIEVVRRFADNDLG